VPKFDVLHCEVAIAGDIRAVVPKYHETAVTWPEFLVLSVLHGEGSMRRPVVVGEVTRTMDEERRRLLGTYDEGAIQTLFGGIASPLPGEAPVEIPRDLMAMAQAAAPVPDAPPPPPEDDPFKPVAQAPTPATKGGVKPLKE
jgi:hypothetical protein